MESRSAPRPQGILPALGEWLLLGLLVVMQFVNLAIGIHGRPERISFFLMGFGLIAVTGLPALVGRGALTRRARLALGSGLLLLVWAVVSASTSQLPRMFQPRVDIGRAYVVIPPVTGLVTMLAAWALATVTRERRGLLRRAALVIVFTTIPAAARTMVARGSVRVATGMGGASTFHVVLLLCLGILLATALERRRSWLDWAGVAIAAVGILLTSSRAGLLCLVLFAVLVGFLLASRGRAAAAAGVMGGLVVLGGAVVALVPAARRLLTVGDYGREANLATAWQTWTTSTESVLWGVGSGRMWPWYAFETGLAEIPWKGLIRTGFGRGLTNPHSLPLGVLVELGIVAMIPLLVVLLMPLVVLVRDWWIRRREQDIDWEPLLPLVAVVATLPALVLDLYLFKNFAISFWWWFVYASLMQGSRPSRPAATTTPGGSAGSTR